MVNDKEYATIYDDFDEGQFGRSEYRDLLRSVSLLSFMRTDTISIKNPDNDIFLGYLTAVVVDSKIEQELRNGTIPLERESISKEIIIDNRKTYWSALVYTYNKNGIKFSFSLEKPGDKILGMVFNHYKDDDKWRDPVLNHYKANYVVRIFTAENVYEPWNDEITYGEALLMATLIGDRSQWLWGIHDGNALLERYNQTVDGFIPPPVFEPEKNY